MASVSSAAVETAQVPRAEAQVLLILTCPNTPEDKDGYDTRYRAHVYEWKRSELWAGLALAGWHIQFEYGLTIDRAVLEPLARQYGFGPLLERIQGVVPPEWYLPVFAPMFPRQASEIALVCCKEG